VVLPYPKAVGRGRIRVKAFAVIFDESCGRIAVARMSTPEHSVFHRPLGGAVAVGENSCAAVIRTVAEQLDVTLVHPELLGVLESIFTIEGETGHEVVFGYAGRLLEQAVIPPQGRSFWEIDRERRVEWRPVTGLADVPLFPAGLQELVDDYLARQPAADAVSAAGRPR